MSPYCIWCSDAAPRIEKYKKVKNLISVKIVKNATWIGDIEVGYSVRAQKCHSAQPLLPICFEWLIFISTQKNFKGTFFPLFSGALTLLKLNYLYLFIIINHPRFIRCLIADQLAGFYMSLFLNVKGTSDGATAKHVLLISNLLL